MSASIFQSDISLRSIRDIMNLLIPLILVMCFLTLLLLTPRKICLGFIPWSFGVIVWTMVLLMFCWFMRKSTIEMTEGTTML